MERGTKFEVYAVVGTKIKHRTLKDGDLLHNIETSDLPIIRALAGKTSEDLYKSLKSILGGKPVWIKKLLAELCDYFFKVKSDVYLNFMIPKDFGQDLESAKQLFNYLMLYHKTVYYEKMVPAIKVLRKKEKELDSNTYAVYRFMLLVQTIIDKI